ncbi:MAG: HAMP domain-containing sensor histidine kinase [Gammaproteobacteria bacterium]|nr:HAMP domain-containing sensor histidine kinase [Gammaproteobacteria bacterium]
MSCELLGLDENRLEEVRSVAAWQFEQLSRRLSPSATPDRVSAARAAILYRALIKSADAEDADALVASAAEHLLGAHATLLFEAENGGLVSHLDGEAIRIATDAADSLLASCYRSGRIASSGGGDVHIVERQLLGRFGDCALTAIPLGNTGILAYLAPPDDTIADVLLQGFADATTDLVTRTTPGETVAVDELQHAVREIIHEVNNPLAIVQNYLRTLSLKLGDDNPVEQEVDTISRELMRAGSLLQKFRHLGQAEPLLLAETDINALVRDIGNVLNEGDDRIIFDYRLDTDIPTLMLPKDALRQVLLNLMKNAVEALGDTAEPRITLSTQGAVNLGGRHFIEIEVSDNGPGMTVDQRLSIFESGQSSKGTDRGYGLGIVNRLIESMSAMVSCRENRIDAQGTTFQLLIPFSYREQDHGEDSP